MKTRTIHAPNQADALQKARTDYGLWDVPIVVHGKPNQVCHIPARDSAHMAELISAYRQRVVRPGHYDLANLNGTSNWVLAWA